MYSRREFLKEAAIVGAGAALGLNLSGCAAELDPVSRLEKTLSNYENITKNWDSVYGPPILLGMYGVNNFEGHLSHPLGSQRPGVDYNVPVETPIVPPAASFMDYVGSTHYGGLEAGLKHLQGRLRTLYAHLRGRFIDTSYHRLLKRNEIFALSGDSGEGPSGFQRPHLHFGLYSSKWKIKEEEGWIDPEKYGIDGGKPVFWDCKTNLDRIPEGRIYELEDTLKDFENELNKWPENLEELKGKLLEHRRMLGDLKGTDILDSKYFHDMRALLKRKILEEKMYNPETQPYSLMLKIVGYSTDEKQKIILTLPFPAPGLEDKYKIPVLEEG